MAGSHALKNALLPVVTVVGLQFGSLLGGAVMTETIFAWPGVGTMMLDAILKKDYPVVLAGVVVVAVGFILVNLPLLAERWENVNPTTWRFHLRRNVKFSNGEPLDAEDVKYSFETYIDAKNRRAPFARGITRVEVRDPHTVDVITEGPLASALFNVVRCYILPKETRDVAWSPYNVTGSKAKVYYWARPAR